METLLEPALGSTVYFTLPAEWNHAGEQRPAVVTRVWSATTVNLLVFLDGDNDKRVGTHDWETVPGYVLWETSVQLNENEIDGTWNYGKAILEPYEA